MICRIVSWGFLALYLVALGLLAVGTFGLFGQEKTPLAGVFLMPLGMPWNLFLEPFGEAFRPLLAMIAPALNAMILFAFCKLFHKPHRQV
jgi:hypothetical protein